MNLLGIDYGRSHLGIALAAGPLAEPLTTLANDSQIFMRLSQIIQAHSIGKIIIGLPDSQIGEEVKKFAQALGEAISTPFDFQDETLTTRDAQISLLHKSRSGRKENEHAAAAAIILQNWLDEQGN